ncbi:hypothetical protein ABZ297_23950 [Nonomuraea sp. NPDC005983]|uniref:hypothetical protein n=1 Tax=Nonomuraea sp. NPDC005983 TaxID=3155595 RepID=UPI0033A4674C
MSWEESRLAARTALARAVEEELKEWSSRTGIAVEVWALPKADVPDRVAKAVRNVLSDVLDQKRRERRARPVPFAHTTGSRGLRLT